MLDRLTEGSQRAIDLAQTEALTLGQKYVSTEYLLLGLLQEKHGSAAQVLKSLGVTLNQIRDHAKHITTQSTLTSVAGVAYTQEAKDVIVLAEQEADSLGRDRVDTEHVLLGLLRANGGLPAPIITDLHLDPEVLRGAILLRLSEGTEPANSGALGAKTSLNFTSAELPNLASRLASVSDEITLTVQRHLGHPPIFQVSCRLCGDPVVLANLADLQSIGIDSIIEEGTIIRLAHRSDV
jgi:ATP-dependent Clp protease ATP-binding subunit ClpC